MSIEGVSLVGDYRRKVIYCHFSFRRKCSETGIFAVALYTDKEGKNLVDKKVKEHILWENHQHITAIQAYENALRCLWEWQPILIEHRVTNVILVTDNSNLAGWIENPRKNKNYYKYMARANSQYRVGASRELRIAVGLAEPRRVEKSYKYCHEKYVIGNNPVGADKIGDHKIGLSESEYSTVLDILDADEIKIDGKLELKDI